MGLADVAKKVQETAAPTDNIIDKKLYTIDWDHVRTPDHLRRIMKASIQCICTMETATLHDIADLVIPLDPIKEEMVKQNIAANRAAAALKQT